jgi:UDP-N-acetylglucosamine 2-epimerase (non-hydrolysing)/GDP/UDP-N,N'-diacetylbacillosamine 2-epimerase (hydrolysing)
MNMYKICVITGTRSEYGLMKPTIERISYSENLILQLVSTGMHLLPEFGLTNDRIKEDGFNIDAEVPMIVGGDTQKSMASSIGVGIIALTQTFSILDPDIVLILGDRFEIFAAAIAASYSGRVVAHIHGGDKLLGGYDEYTRHAITKISHIHFPATEKSAKRILQLGEEPERIFIVGSPSLETILNKELHSKDEICRLLDMDPKKDFVLLVQHSISTEPEKAGEEIRLTLEVLLKSDYPIVLIYPNSDPGGLKMIEVIHEYEKRYPQKIVSFKSLPFEHYLSLLKNSKFMIGNSSSGIIESSSFHIPVINIGKRQQGRERADNVIDVGYSEDEINAAIDKVLYDSAFLRTVKECKNPYGEGITSKIICETLSNLVIDGNMLTKRITYD